MNNIVNDIISTYIDAFYQEQTEDLKELRAFAEERYVPIILKDTEELLRIILALQKPARILEIGTAIGYSACFFAETCGAHITTIERDPDYFRTAVSNVRQLGHDGQVDVLFGEASEVLQKLALSTDTAAEGFDFIFIDASKSHYREFWDLCAPLCADDGLIICDNVLMRGLTATRPEEAAHKHRTSIRNMRDFLQFLKELPYADTCILTVGDGISISRIDRTAYQEETGKDRNQDEEC